jgi:hypothetical protein
MLSVSRAQPNCAFWAGEIDIARMRNGLAWFISFEVCVCQCPFCWLTISLKTGDHVFQNHDNPLSHKVIGNKPKSTWLKS